jgi:hypothetical protein
MEEEEEEEEEARYKYLQKGKTNFPCLLLNNVCSLIVHCP